MNSYLFQSHVQVISKFWKAITFSPTECWSSILLGWLALGWILTSFQFLGRLTRENISFLFWEQNIPLKNSVTGKDNMDRGYLISFFSHVSQLIVVQCLYKLENEPDVWNFNFCSPELSCGSKLQLVIMFTMILDSLENMKIRKEKSPLMNSPFWSIIDLSLWSIVDWSLCCIQNFKTPIWRLFLLFEGSRATNLALT